jgi:hypothetical protein
MTAVEYAKHRDCSDSYIRRLRRRGLVIDCAHGHIDVAASDRSLDENLHPIRGGDRTAPPAGADAPDESPPESGAHPAGAGAADDSAPFGPLSREPSVNEAVRRERLARARLAEIELGERQGELIIKADAERATVTLVRQAIVRMRLMGSRLRGPLAAESDPRKVELMIDAEVDEICKDFRKAAADVSAGQVPDESQAAA